MGKLMKLTEHGGQYRITIPRKLVEAAGLKDAEVVYLYVWDGRVICVEEYYGKRQEKRDIPEDQS